MEETYLKILRILLYCEKVRPQILHNTKIATRFVRCQDRVDMAKSYLRSIFELKNAEVPGLNEKIMMGRWFDTRKVRKIRRDLEFVLEDVDKLNKNGKMLSPDFYPKYLGLKNCLFEAREYLNE